MQQQSPEEPNLPSHNNSLSTALSNNSMAQGETPAETPPPPPNPPLRHTSKKSNRALWIFAIVILLLLLLALGYWFLPSLMGVEREEFYSSMKDAVELLLRGGKDEERKTTGEAEEGQTEETRESHTQDTETKTATRTYTEQAVIANIEALSDEEIVRIIEESDYFEDLISGATISLEGRNQLALTENEEGELVLDVEEGPGSGLDADIMDGLESSSFLRSNASDTYEGGNTLTFVGSTDFDGDVTISDADILFDALNTTFTQSSGSLNLASADDVVLTLTDDVVFNADDLIFNDGQVTGIQLSDADTSLPNLNIGIVDSINDAWNAAVGGASGLWLDGGNYVYLNSGLASNIQTAEDSWLGISGSDVRIIFDGTGGDISIMGANVGIGTMAPGAALEVLETTEQLRLAYDGSNHTSFTVASDGDLTVNPTGTGQLIFQPTTDSATFYQVLDADGGTPILNIDATNEYVGIGVASPNNTIQVVDLINFDNTTYSTYLGYQAGNTGGSGDYNTFIGYQSGNPISGGNNNAFLGYRAGYNWDCGNNSVAVGAEALYSNVCSDDNTAVGYQALYTESNGNANVAVGYQALYTEDFASGNVAVGAAALYSTTWGSGNTGVGSDALNQNTEGQYNVAIGADALRANTTGDDNTALGSEALASNSIGEYNVALGSEALYYSQSGGYNTVIGYQSGRGASSNSYSNNTFVGAQSGYFTSTGGNNVFIGYQAGLSNTTGAGNVFLGYQAGLAETGSNKLYIENSSAAPTSALVYGDFNSDILAFNADVGIGTTGPGQELEVDGDIRLDANESPTTNGLCHSGADSDTTFENRDIVACSAAPGDIAEWYDIKNGNAGDIVATTGETVTYKSPAVNARTGEVLNKKETLTASVLTKTAQQYQPNTLGVISTSPYETFGKSIIDHSKNPNPVALTGRVPVKVSTINGSIEPGDPITASDIPGVGMKATKPGLIVGRALESYTNVNPNAIKKIMLFVNVSWYESIDYLADLDAVITNYKAGLLRDASLEVIDSPTFTNATILENLLTQNLVTEGDANFKGTLVINGDVSMQAGLKVLGHITVGQDTAGEIVIPAGKTEAHVTFKTPYQKPPIVHITPKGQIKGQYWVEEVTKSSFKIKLDTIQENPSTINWIVVQPQ